MPAIPGSGRPRSLILTAMILAVSMTFIDMTIISIAVPPIQRDLGLSTTGVQWTVNGYLLTLAALFAFGGRLADTFGHRRMVTLGVIVFAAASGLCGLTPRGGTSTLAAVPRFVRADFAHASQTVFLVMAGIMDAAALVALTGLRAGRQEEPGGAGTVPGWQAPHEQAGARP